MSTAEQVRCESCLCNQGEVRRENMRAFRKKIVVLWLLAACLCGSMVAGCNTVHGAGKDIERAGEGIQRAVD